jgi:hypothetical protein
MINKTATKKTRKPHVQSKAAQIRKLFEQGKWTSKQIAEKLGTPLPYVYVVRSKMKAEAGGLPAVSTKSPIPVSGGIQDIAYQHAPVKQEGAAVYSPSVTMIEKPTFLERVKNKIHAWLT